jgi:Protein of unknown function (DUF2934)
MPKKKTTEPSAPATVPDPRRRRAPAKRAAEPVQTPSVANDREPMPEPAGQRVTPAEATEADSVTFVSLAPTEPSYEEIARAAYLRYLNRGGSDGQAFEDWIAAEQELRAR